MTSLKRGPGDPVPQSGRRSGYSNRKKLVRHTEATIALLEHALRHARRALERAKGERRVDK